MKFYVIYAFDCTPGYRYLSDIDVFEEDGWKQTEDDDDWEYNYLAEENPHNAHIWKDGIHRKYVHDSMTKEEFLRFIRTVGLEYEPVETMGSITDIGWLPALSFQGNKGMTVYDYAGIISQSAYVTPIPEPVRPLFSVRHNQDGFFLTKEEIDSYGAARQNRAWDLIRSAFDSANS